MRVAGETRRSDLEKRQSEPAQRAELVRLQSRHDQCRETLQAVERKASGRQPETDAPSTGNLELFQFTSSAHDEALPVRQTPFMKLRVRGEPLHRFRPSTADDTGRHRANFKKFIADRAVRLSHRQDSSDALPNFVPSPPHPNSHILTLPAVPTPAVAASIRRPSQSPLFVAICGRRFRNRRVSRRSRGAVNRSCGR